MYLEQIAIKAGKPPVAIIEYEKRQGSGVKRKRERLEEGANLFELSGEITFDSSPDIVTKGEKALVGDDADRWEVDLTHVKKADSSALSVLLSWVRLSQKHQKMICFEYSVCCKLQKLNNPFVFYDYLEPLLQLLLFCDQ